MNNDTTDEQARISQLYADNKAAFQAAQESAAKGDWQSFEKTLVVNDTPADAIMVIQADIEAVKRFHAESARWMLDAIKNGRPIGEERDLNHPIYQAFARHRTTSLAAQDVVDALRKALNLAVMTLAFIGRDQGTTRIEATLDGLCELAKEADPIIRAALASIEVKS